MRLLPDTNVLIYETVEDSDHHAEACSLLDKASEIHVPSIVLHEYVWVASKLGIGLKIILAKAAEYLNEPRAYYFAEPLSAYRSAIAMLLEDGADRRSFNDYLILAVALRSKLTLATYDRELREAAVKRGVKVLP